MGSEEETVDAGSLIAVSGDFSAKTDAGPSSEALVGAHSEMAGTTASATVCTVSSAAVDILGVESRTQQDRKW
jgi:hypothetical protein